MTTVKLGNDIIKELRLLKAELGYKSYSELLVYIIKVFKERK